MQFSAKDLTISMKKYEEEAISTLLIEWTYFTKIRLPNMHYT